MLDSLTKIPFNWLDALLALLLLASVVRSVIAGFTRTAFSILGLLAGFWAAMHFTGDLVSRLAPWVASGPLRFMISFLIVFFTVYVGFTLVGAVIQAVFRILHLSWLDRLLGALLGALRGLIAAAALVFLLTILLPSRHPLLKGSVLYPRLMEAARGLTVLVPHSVKGRFMWHWRHLRLGGKKGEAV